MFARVGRLTGFGAHAIANCPYRREKTYQAQRQNVPINDQRFNIGQSFSDSFHNRTTSIGSDPFFGVTTDEEREVIRELELLDLDSWQVSNKGYIGTSSQEAPNSMVINAPSAPSDNLDFNEWSNYAPMNQNRNGFLVCGHTTKKVSNEELDLNELDALNTLSGSKNTIAVCGRDPRIPEEAAVKHETAHELFQRSDSLAPFFTGQQQPKIMETSKFEFDVDNVAKMVDWEAWNKYLGDEEPQTNDEYDSSLINEDNQSSFDFPSAIPYRATDRHVQSNVVPIPFQGKIDVMNLSDPSLPSFNKKVFADTTRVPNSSPDVQPLRPDDNLFSSGPITYFPQQSRTRRSSSSGSCTSNLRIRKTREIRSTRSSVRAESQRSLTPLSEDFDFEEKPKYKKRGVIMKPSVDDETDKRRALNRNAALRYREKKRMEKMERNREYMDVSNRNRHLHFQYKQLKKEIREMRHKLEKHGVL